MNVSARDKATGKEQRITITASTNLSKQEVERLVKDAERYAAEDRRRRELAEVRNQADTLIYQAEKSLRELGDGVPANRPQPHRGPDQRLAAGNEWRGPGAYPATDRGPAADGVRLGSAGVCRPSAGQANQAARHQEGIPSKANSAKCSEAGGGKRWHSPIHHMGTRSARLQ